MRSQLFRIFALLVFTSTCMTASIDAKQDDFPPSSAAYNYSQAEKAFNEADKKLNEIYGQIMTGKFVNIADDVGKKMLRESQRAWIKFRDTNCEMFGQVAGGASNWKAAYSMNCKGALTKKRVDDLKEILSVAIEPQE